jgi:mutator protein MutT
MTIIVVTAAVIERDGRFLVTRRQQGVHLEGYWEFPGGKCEAGEPLDACLVRELREELDVEAHVGEEVLATTHPTLTARSSCTFSGAISEASHGLCLGRRCGGQRAKSSPGWSSRRRTAS